MSHQQSFLLHRLTHLPFPATSSPTDSMPCGLTGLVVAGVSLDNAAIKPHVGNSHAVLGQGSCLVGADGGGGAQGFHSFQVLHQAVLAGHALGRQRQTHLQVQTRLSVPPAGSNRIISSTCRIKHCHQFQLQDQTLSSVPPAGSNISYQSLQDMCLAISQTLAGTNSYQFLAVRVRCKHNYQFLQAMHLAVRVSHTHWCKHNYLVESDQHNLIFKPNQMELTELHLTDHCLKSKLLFLASHLKY